MVVITTATLVLAHQSLASATLLPSFIKMFIQKCLRKGSVQRVKLRHSGTSSGFTVLNSKAGIACIT